MTTATALGTRAAERFKDTGGSVVTAAQWLSYCNEAYNLGNAFSPLWPWLETAEQTVNFTANNHIAALPANVLTVNWAYNTTDDFPLVPQEGRGDQYHRGHLRSDTGLPNSYRVRGSSLELYPTPAAATAVVVEGMLLPVALAGGDSPVWPVGFHDLLIDGMLAAAYLDDGSSEMAAQHSGRFEQRLSDMRNGVLLARTETNVPIRDTFWS